MAVALALLGLVGLGALVVGVPFLALVGATAPGGDSTGAPASARAARDIPQPMLDLYRRAAETCPGLGWSVLAAVGKVESDHGRSTLPGVHSGANAAGAMGPMQFLAATWAAYGLDADQDGDADVYDPADAVFGAAAYLCANGAGHAERLRGALYRYNHSTAYVEQVLRIAAGYAGTGAGGPPAGAGPAPEDGGDGVQAVALESFRFPLVGPAAGSASFSDDYRSPRASGGQCPDHPAWHCATDVFAARGTPVMAPIDGVLTRVGYQRLGGNRVWVEGPADRFYLAHMDALVPRLAEGRPVHAGDRLGTLGSTGSAAGTPPHLHLAWEHRGPRGWVNTNPYRLLVAARAAAPAAPSP